MYYHYCFINSYVSKLYEKEAKNFRHLVRSLRQAPTKHIYCTILPAQHRRGKKRYFGAVSYSRIPFSYEKSPYLSIVRPFVLLQRKRGFHDLFSWGKVDVSLAVKYGLYVAMPWVFPGGGSLDLEKRGERGKKRPATRKKLNSNGEGRGG